METISLPRSLNEQSTLACYTSLNTSVRSTVTVSKPLRKSSMVVSSWVRSIRFFLVLIRQSHQQMPLIQPRHLQVPAVQQFSKTRASNRISLRPTISERGPSLEKLCAINTKSDNHANKQKVFLDLTKNARSPSLSPISLY